MSILKETVVKKKCGISRHEKEMAIQLSEMENYKWLRSKYEGNNIGKKAYFEWVEQYSEQVRCWLEGLGDEEVDKIYKGLSNTIKLRIEKKIR